MKWTGAERRRSDRAGIHMESILEGGAGQEDIHLEVVNFSVGGFLCLTTRPLAPMTRLGIRFVFPPYAEHPARGIDACAVVVRCEPPSEREDRHRMAACFTEMPPEGRRHIEGYVRWWRLVHEAVKTEAA